jgi:hypothetical protein
MDGTTHHYAQRISFTLDVSPALGELLEFFVRGWLKMHYENLMSSFYR